jgi:hypothetical protein
MPFFLKHRNVFSNFFAYLYNYDMVIWYTIVKDLCATIKHAKHTHKSDYFVPCEQSPLVFLLGTARRSERDSAELVYILCGADNPKTWIIMRNFRFDTGFITCFDPNRKLLIKSSSGK